MSRFIRIVIFTLLIATIVFFGFRALLSTNTLQATTNNQLNSESNLSQAEQTDTPSAESNPGTEEASGPETQTYEINKDPSDNKDSNNSNKKSAGENDKEKPE